MQRLVGLVFLGCVAVTHAARPNPGVPGFLGAVKTHLALLDSVEMSGNSSLPVVNKIAEGVMPRAHLVTQSMSASEAALCAAQQKTIFCPRPETLQGWKDHAGCCLSHCGTGRETCFDMCIHDCVKFRLDCTGLATENDCFATCKRLGECDKCVAAVKPDGTSACQKKCLVDFDEKTEGDKCSVGR